MALNLADEGVTAVRRAIADSNDPTSWLLLQYSPNTPSPTLQVYQSGSAPPIHGLRDCLSEFVGKGGEVGFGYGEVLRQGFVVVYIGDEVGGVRRARAVVHSRAVASLFPDYSALVTISHPSQLTDELITSKLELSATHTPTPALPPKSMTTPSGQPSPLPLALSYTTTTSIKPTSSSNSSSSINQNPIPMKGISSSDFFPAQSTSTQSRNGTSPTRSRKTSLGSIGSKIASLRGGTSNRGSGGSNGTGNGSGGGGGSGSAFSNLTDRFGAMRSGNTPPTSPRNDQNGFSHHHQQQQKQAPPVPPKDMTPSTSSSSHSHTHTHTHTQPDNPHPSLNKPASLQPIISSDSLPDRTDEYGRKLPPRLEIVNPDPYPQSQSQTQTRVPEGEGLGYGLHHAQEEVGGGLSPSPSAKRTLSEVSQKRVQAEGEMMRKFRDEQAQRERERVGHVDEHEDEGVGHEFGSGNRSGSGNGIRRERENSRELEEADMGLAYDRLDHSVGAPPPSDDVRGVGNEVTNGGEDKRVSLGRLPSRFSLGAVVDPDSPSRFSMKSQPHPHRHPHSESQSQHLIRSEINPSQVSPQSNFDPHSSRNEIPFSGSNRSIPSEGRFDDLEEGDDAGDDGGAGYCIVKDYALGDVLGQNEQNGGTRPLRFTDRSSSRISGQGQGEIDRVAAVPDEEARIRMEGEERARRHALEEQRELVDEHRRRVERERERLMEDERVEAGRVEEERRRLEGLEREKRERDRREAMVRVERERVLERERIERERSEEMQRIEVERVERERLERERIEGERLKKIREEEERIESERVEKETAVRVRKESLRTKLRDGKASGAIMLSGWVTVQTTKSTIWRRRWFGLYGGELRLYKTEHDVKPIQIVVLGQGTRISQTYEESQVKGSFKVVSPQNGDEYFMFADSLEDKETILEGFQLASS